MPNDEEEILLCLKFTDKIEQQFFLKSNIFFKIENIGLEKPLIQIENHVFQGTYEDVIGTNVFFEEITEPRETDKIFIQPTPIHLKYLNKSAKILNLKWIKVPEQVVTVDKSDLKETHFIEDYNQVLHKIANNTLNIQEKVGIKPVKKNNDTQEKSNKQLLDSASNEAAVTKEINSQVTEQLEEMEIITTKSNYELLRDVAEQPPTKREDNCEETAAESLFSNDDCCKDFVVLKQLYLNSLEVYTVTKNVNNESIEQLVDIPNSIKDGIIKETSDVKLLTDEDKQKLISIENFDNLTIPLKLALLMEHLSEQKKVISNLNKDELKMVDSYDRTPKERYRLLKSLSKDLHYYLFRNVYHKR